MFACTNSVAPHSGFGCAAVFMSTYKGLFPSSTNDILYLYFGFFFTIVSSTARPTAFGVPNVQPSGLLAQLFWYISSGMRPAMASV